MKLSLLAAFVATITLSTLAPAQDDLDSHLYHVPLYESPSATHRRTGVVRIENLSGERGDVTITALEDDGTAHGPITITVNAATVTHVNARDLEEGNPDKGIDQGLGVAPAHGRWRLELRTDLALRVLRYARTADGFLTVVEPVPRVEGACTQPIHTFNPASNHDQVSMLRLINPGDEEATVFIRGTDDTGAPSADTVSLTLAPHTARHLDSNALESGDGEGLDGALGNGTGKWRLLVTSEQHVIAMNLLRSPTGHLTTLTAPSSSDSSPLEGRAVKLTQHADNIIIAKIEGCLATSRIDFAHIAKSVIETYGDHFDFILLSSNLASVQDNTRYRYSGTHHRVQNDIEGIGVALGPTWRFDAVYGDREHGQLEAFIHFTFRYGLTRGPGLHEIMHTWANFVVDTVSHSHWGFSSANGQLGGYDIADLVRRGNNQYTAGRFGTFANRGNSVPYSPIELYLAGWLEAEQVPPLVVAQDARWVTEDGMFQRDENGNFIFHATGLETWTIERIIERHGARRPDHHTAQRRFRAAFVLLTDHASPGDAEQLDALSEEIDAFARDGSDGISWSQNFWEATRGVATLRLEGLSAALASAAAEPKHQAGTAPQPPAANKTRHVTDQEHDHSEDDPHGDAMWVLPQLQTHLQSVNAPSGKLP